MPYPIWHLTFEIVGAYENDHPDFEINVSTEDAQGTELPTDSVLEPAITNLAKIAICLVIDKIPGCDREKAFYVRCTPRSVDVTKAVIFVNDVKGRKVAEGEGISVVVALNAIRASLGKL